MRRPHPRSWNLARQLLVLEAAVLLLVVLAAGLLGYADARHDANRNATDRTWAIAQSVADSPDVRSALGSRTPSAVLQPYADQVQRDSGVDFVVVMAPDRTRYSHPNPALLGKPFIGTIAPALEGRTFSETFTGTLGPSVRTVAPVRSGDRVIGLVAVGITVEAVGADLRRQLPELLLAALGILTVAVAGTLLVVRRLRRLTYGLGAEELSRMYSYYDAVLHTVKEGLLLIGTDGRVQLANDEARRVLALPDDAIGRPVGELGLPGELASALGGSDSGSDGGSDDGSDGGAGGGGRPVVDELYIASDRVVAVNVGTVSTLTARGRPVTGRVVTVRDRTDLQELTGELDSARGMAEALRSQAHESANRLHTVISLVELGRPDDAIEFAVGELQAAQALTDRVVEAVEEPVVAALLLGKSAVAAERGAELIVDPRSELDAGALDRAGVPARDLVTILGNLIDNGLDAVADTPPPRRVEVLIRSADGLELRVADTGPGLDTEAAQHAFERGWSTKPANGRRQGRGLGLALVGQTVHRHAGTITVTRAPGATLTIHLPLPHQAPSPASSPPPGPSPASPSRSSVASDHDTPGGDA